MISRRVASLGLLVSPAFLAADPTRAQTAMTADQPFDQLIYPPFTALNPKTLFGYNKPTDDQRKKASEIIANTPKGPLAIDVAQSFVDRFYDKDAEAISQWPAPAAWNPLIVAFFGATATTANNDMIAWCAAFANYCIERNGGKGSRSAASQSFLSSTFKRTKEPKRGDLVVFTCFNLGTDKSLGLGHVTFFKEKVGENQIRVVGGSQSKDGHSSIISESVMSTADRTVKRHLDSGAYVDTTMKLNTFISMT